MILDKYNSWTVLQDLKHDDFGCRIVRCQCKCGIIKDKKLYALVHGHSKQCNDCFKGPSLSGTRIGTWSIKNKVYVEKRKEWYYRCVCDCGNTTDIPGAILKSGKSKGCLPCSKKVYISRKNRTYISWQVIRNRCLVYTSPGFQQYGGRGITICDRWKDSFENFLADMGIKPIGLSLDRINNNGNYEPSNCRWANSRQPNSDKIRKKAVHTTK